MIHNIYNIHYILVYMCVYVWSTTIKIKKKLLEALFFSQLWQYIYFIFKIKTIFFFLLLFYHNYYLGLFLFFFINENLI